MDPNAVLQKIMDLQAALVRQLDEVEKNTGDTISADLHDNVSELCDAIGSLDGWMARGGFLPERWDQIKRTEPVKCEICNGTGKILVWKDHFHALCWDCHGSGDIAHPNKRDPRSGEWVPDGEMPK